MTVSTRKMAVLTSGGDAPGMNAAIRAATMLATARGWQVVGVKHGYRGLLRGDFMALDPGVVAPIVRRGGTILGSARCPEFLEQPARDKARAHLRDAGIEGLIVIGGNGSLAGAAALSDPDEAGADPVRVIGVPASIDNDVGVTGISIGVDTAMNTIVEACDKITDTADAHARTFIVEVMGRQCGYLAMTSAIAAGADAVLFPESERTEDEIVDSIVDTVRKVRARVNRTRRVLVIKAEGVGIPIDRLKRSVDERMREEPGGDPGTTETRVTVLGHVVRGGRPTAFDRVLSSRLSHAAVTAIIGGATRRMVAWVPPVKPSPTTAERSPVDPYCWLASFESVLEDTRRMTAMASSPVQWRARVFDELESVLAL